MDKRCPVEGISLNTLALNYGLSDPLQVSNLIESFESQKVHLSFRDYLDSVSKENNCCKTSCETVSGNTDAYSPSSLKYQVSTKGFPLRNIGARSKKRGVKHYKKVHGKKPHAVHHVSKSKGRSDYQHTSTTHRAKGNAISGVGGVVVKHTGPISAKSAAEPLEVDFSPGTNTACDEHCKIGDPVSINQQENIEGTIAVLKAGMIGVVIQSSRSASSLFVEHVAVTIKYTMEAYKYIVERKDNEKELDKAEENMFRQIENWQSRFYCITMKSGGFDKTEAKALYKLFAEEINKHLMYAKNFIDATYENDEDSQQSAREKLLGENLIVISEYLATITGGEEGFEDRMKEFKDLWKEHIMCTAGYVSARMKSDEKFDEAATKCLRQGSKLGNVIDKHSMEGSADLRRRRKVEMEREESVGECIHGEDEMCGNCCEYDDSDYEEERSELETSAIQKEIDYSDDDYDDDEISSSESRFAKPVGVSLAKRKRARRYVKKHGIHYRKKKPPHKGSLMRKQVIFVGDNLADKHKDSALIFAEELVRFAKRTQEEPQSSMIVSHAALADSIITKCYEQCGQDDLEQFTSEEEVNKKVGSMISGFTGALCTSLEMAAIYQPHDVVRGSSQHEDIKVKAEIGGYNSDVPLLDEYPGARIAHAELVFSILDNIRYFPIKGVRKKGDESSESIKNQWQKVIASHFLMKDYPELKAATKVPMSAYLRCSTIHQENKRRDPDYHMLPTEVLVQSIASAQNNSRNKKDKRPLIEDYKCEDVAEPASQIAALFSAKGVDNAKKNIISIHIGSSLIGKFEQMKSGEDKEIQELRGGRYCSVRGITSKHFYDTIAQLIHHLRSSDLVSNDASLRKEVEAHIKQSFNHVDRLITPPDHNIKEHIGKHGLVQQFAKTGIKSDVIYDINRHKKCTSSLKKGKQSIKTNADTSFCPSNGGNSNKKKMLSLADIDCSSDEEEIGSDETSQQEGRNGSELWGGRYSSSFATNGGSKPSFKITRERIF